MQPPSDPSMLISNIENMVVFFGFVCTLQNSVNLRRAGKSLKIIQIGSVLFVIRVEEAGYSGKEAQLCRIARAATK
jgi:hypothetical protein